MITDNEIQMSKMSYSQKDFGTIYPSLLDLAKLLTSKWDPSLSNESDPGVVLLKEGAFIADHTNYNIDKNVLESFLPSATQESSVRNIVDMNGYNPRYYVSATGDVSFTYQADEDETFEAFSIPKFTLKVANDDDTITYTQISNLTINENKVASACQFIEGTLNTLEVDGSTTILLENLDENNRIYFPVSYVAQNGIYVANVDDKETFWERTDYLLTKPLKSLAYKVGYDSNKGVPYVEFPSDIASIIGSGLYIRYISTTGASGNISSGTLSKITSDTTYKIGTREIDLEKMTLVNNSSFTNGKDPETIDEMYQSFKKIVGTFDTLVTKLDYKNAINTQVNTVSNKKLVSNSVVTDVTDDYNHATKIVAYDEYGPYFETATFLSGIAGITFKFKLLSEIQNPPEKGDVYFDQETSSPPYYKYYDGTSWQPLPATLSYSTFTQATATMSPFDLYVYAMQAYNAGEYTDKKHWYAINNSFKPASKDYVDQAILSLEDLKCVNHNFKQPVTGDILFFKNYVPLYVTITPYNKVTAKEKESIINSVYRAISENFNAGQLDFGEELSYDNIVQILLNADDRIKNIRLENLQYTPKAVRKTESGYEEVNVYSGDVGLLVDMIAKNILAGRLCMFEFDDTFKCEFGLIAPDDLTNLVVENVESIASETKIYLNTNLITSDLSGQTKTNYSYSSASGSNIYLTLTGGSTTIAAGSTYTLRSGETLKVDYNESSGITSKSATYQNADSNNYYEVTNNTGSAITLTNGQRSNGIQKDKVVITFVLKAAVTLNNISLATSLSDNEYLHISYQSYSTDKVYPTYINYRFTTTRLGGKITPNVDFKLEAGDYLVMLYTSDGAQITQEYGPGEVIKSNFEISPTTSGNKKTWEDQYGVTHTNELFATLGASEQIEHRVKMTTVLSSTVTPCYWIRSGNNNNLFPNATLGAYNTTTLGSGEYFIYSNQNKDALVLLGAGTKLRGFVTTANEWELDDDTSIESIQDEGFASGLEWQYKDFSTNNFEISERVIVTLGKGDTVQIYNWSNPPEYISNEPVTCTGTIKYTLSDGTSATLNAISDGYELRSRLDLSLSGEVGQVLTSNQTIYLTTSESSTDIEYTNCCIKSSAEINTYGDTSLNIKKLLNKTISVEKYSITGAACKVVYAPPSGVVKSLTTVNGKTSVAIDGNLTATLPFMYRFGVGNNRRYILPIYANLSDNTSTIVTISVGNFVPANTNYGIREYNSGQAFASSMTMSSKGMYLLEVEKQNPESSASDGALNMVLKVEATSYSASDEIVITAWDPVVHKGLNSNLTYGGLITLANVENKIKLLVDASTKSTTKPYYINVPEASIAIQDDDISNSNIFWDINNIVNHITIPQIDITGSNIDIIKSMRNYT